MDASLARSIADRIQGAAVRDEVRMLAQRSSAAAKEIKELTETSSEKVPAGGTLVTEAGGRMQAILTGVRRVAYRNSTKVAVAAQTLTLSHAWDFNGDSGLLIDFPGRLWCFCIASRGIG
jgi:methyl-accepting chemotaxis protein